MGQGDDSVLGMGEQQTLGKPIIAFYDNELKALEKARALVILAKILVYCCQAISRPLCVVCCNL